MKRNTIQKEIILNTVKKLACHVTSETVYDYIHKKNPHISKSTVYRNLRSLADDHLIKKVTLPGDVERFDPIIIPHYHARCNKCGKIFDVTIKTPDHLEDTIVLPEGFQTDNHEILFTGICKSCQDKKKKASKMQKGENK